MDKIPLNCEASEGDTHKQLTNALPPEVVQCLQNARFVRLMPRAPSRIPERVADGNSFIWRHAPMTCPTSPS